jgi:hypothetical protein
MDPGCERIYDGGLDPVVLRWNSTLHRGRIMPYIELGGGTVRPAGTTSAYNRLARGGGGSELLCGKRHSLDFACRWWHISNANLGVRDLEFNGIQVGFGYHWLK